MHVKRNRVNDFSGCHPYRLYRLYEFYLHVIFYQNLVEIDKLTEVGNVCHANHLRMQTIETPIWVIGSTSKGRGAGAWEVGFAKVLLPNPRASPDCKIIPSPILLGY